MTGTPRSGLALDELSADIRPQDDLYRHVNGAWLDRTQIPDDKARWGAFHLLHEAAEQHVRDIILESQSAEPGTEARKIGDLYASFMDEAVIADRGLEPIRDQLERVAAITDVPSLLRTIGELEREGVGGFLGVFIEPDPGNPGRYVPFLVQGGTTLPDESYYRLPSFAELRVAYRAHIERMLELAGIADAAEKAEKVLALETEIAAHHWDNVRSRDAVATYNLRTWAQVLELAGLDLDPWLSAVAPGREDAFAEVVVYQPDFVASLGSVITDDNLAAWKAWLEYAVVRGSAAFLTDELVGENFAFFGTQLTGVPVNRERWKRGVSLAQAALGEAIGRVYVERHFPAASKTAMDALVANLLEAYRQSIAQLEWMGPDTRERALEKLAAFTPKIGYPVVWRDYSALDIDASDLIGNVRRSNAVDHDRQLAKVGRPIDRDEWHMTPQTVNAYYNPLMNEVVFPAAILQYPFFDGERDDAANYGAIGAVIGHEIGHGFDDQGSRYDGSGALRDWWTDDDRAAFDERTRALIAQYEVLVPQGLSPENHVNGALTIGENIGDLGGLGIAIRAYELSLGGREAPVIDGLTGIQRLLLSWAQVWRQASREAETIRLLTTDPHSPNEFRCNQIVRNLDAFHDAFGVVESDELWLAPEERVTIW